MFLKLKLNTKIEKHFSFVDVFTFCFTVNNEELVIQLLRRATFTFLDTQMSRIAVFLCLIDIPNFKF